MCQEHLHSPFTFRPPAQGHTDTVQVHLLSCGWGKNGICAGCKTAMMPASPLHQLCAVPKVWPKVSPRLNKKHPLKSSRKQTGIHIVKDDSEKLLTFVFCCFFNGRWCTFTSSPSVPYVEVFYEPTVSRISCTRHAVGFCWFTVLAGLLCCFVSTFA